MDGTLVFALCAVVAGASLQRITGMGFALVSAPFLVLMFGPFEGVLAANACSAVVAAILLARLWRRIDWSRLAVLIPAALLGIVPGAWVAVTVPARAMDVIVGLAVIAGISLSFVAARFGLVTGRLPLVSFGFASGIMNVTAGVGGPALSVYGIASRWTQLSFAATLQPLFLVMGIASIVAKSLSGDPITGALPQWMWAALAAAVMLGVVCGNPLARRVSPLAARRLLIGLGYIGGAATLARGVMGA